MARLIASEIEERLNAVQDFGVGLDAWEQNFIESLSEQWEEHGGLSPKQEEILVRLYQEKT